MDTLGCPRQWLERFLRDTRIGEDRAVRELRCLCDMLEEAARFDQVNVGPQACLEVEARRLKLIVDGHKQGSAPSYVSAKYLTPLRLMRSLPRVSVPTCRDELEKIGKWCKAPRKRTEPRQ